MAKTPTPPPAESKVLPSQVLKSISQKKLKQLLAHARSTKQDVDEIVGTHRSQIAEAVEKNNLHKGAFAMVKRLDRLEPGKLADWLDYLDHYLDISGLRDRAATAPRLAMGDADEGGGEAADEGEGTSRRRSAEGAVRGFPRPAAVAAE